MEAGETLALKSRNLNGADEDVGDEQSQGLRPGSRGGTRFSVLQASVMLF
jgi:hypothetical protein